MKGMLEEVNAKLAYRVSKVLSNTTRIFTGSDYFFPDIQSSNLGKDQTDTGTPYQIDTPLV